MQEKKKKKKVSKNLVFNCLLMKTVLFWTDELFFLTENRRRGY